MQWSTSDSLPPVGNIGIETASHAGVFYQSPACGIIGTYGLSLEQRGDKQEEQVAFLVRTHQEPTYQLYDNGCVFDAWTYVSDLVRKATQCIILIDNYVDDRVLSIMQKRADGVACTIHTRYTEQFQTDLKKHNEQYSEIMYVQLPHKKHDRYLIVDEVVYMLGDSLKNMGGSLTTIIRTEMMPDEVPAKLD